MTFLLLSERAAVDRGLQGLACRFARSGAAGAAATKTRLPVHTCPLEVPPPALGLTPAGYALSALGAEPYSSSVTCSPHVAALP